MRMELICDLTSGRWRGSSVFRQCLSWLDRASSSKTCLKAGRTRYENVLKWMAGCVLVLVFDRGLGFAFWARARNVDLTAVSIAHSWATISTPISSAKKRSLLISSRAHKSASSGRETRVKNAVQCSISTDFQRPLKKSVRFQTKSRRHWAQTLFTTSCRARPQRRCDGRSQAADWMRDTAEALAAARAVGEQCDRHLDLHGWHVGGGGALCAMI